MTLLLTQSITEAEQVLTTRALSGAPVLDQDGVLRGILTQRDIQQVPQDARRHRQVADLMTTQMLLATPSGPLDEVLERLSTSQRSRVPVVGENLHDLEKPSLVGMLSIADITRAYRLTLTSDLRRMQGLVKGTALVEIQRKPGMPLVGSAFQEVHLPADCLVIALRREEEMLFPQSRTVLKVGDVVTFLVSSQGEEALHRYLETIVPPDSEETDALLLS